MNSNDDNVHTIYMNSNDDKVLIDCVIQITRNGENPYLGNP